VAEVVVQLQADITHALQAAGDDPPEFEALTAKVAEVGAELERVHPLETDPELARHFRAEVADDETAEQLASALRAAPGVDGAYVKPAAAPP
jgi:hypothetical protein